MYKNTASSGWSAGRNSPLFPVVMINGFQSPSMYLQAGIFGIGPNSKLTTWNGREDVSYQLIWQLEAFEIGNLARIKQQAGLQSQSIIDLNKTQDKVAAEVTQAQRFSNRRRPRRTGRPCLAHGDHRLQRKL